MKETTYLELLKDVQSAFIPAIESNRIQYAFYVGQLCWYLMQEIAKEDETIGIDELLTDCMEEMELSRNQVSNTSLFYNWTVEQGMVIDADLNMDILFSWWEHKQGGFPTIAKINRLICPKPAKEDREVKKATIKRQIGLAIAKSDYVDVKCLNGANMILNLQEGI
jgi:hypothetical protein